MFSMHSIHARSADTMRWRRRREEQKACCQPQADAGMEAKEKSVTKEELEAYFASFVGMTGNAEAAVWFCEESPHSQPPPFAPPYRAPQHPQTWDAAFLRQNSERLPQWQNHQKIARILAAATEVVRELPTGAIDPTEYFFRDLYAAQGNAFCLSLFPLPARGDHKALWAAYQQCVPLAPRQRYRDLCSHGARFRFIANLRRQMRPKLVVCTGSRTPELFLQALGFHGANGEDAVIQPADQARSLRLYHHEGTTLVLAPPLAGVSGLSSNVLLEALGRYLARWLAAADLDLSTEPATQAFDDYALLLKAA